MTNSKRGEEILAHLETIFLDVEHYAVKLASSVSPSWFSKSLENKKEKLEGGGIGVCFILNTQPIMYQFFLWILFQDLKTLFIPKNTILEAWFISIIKWISGVFCT